MLITDGVSGYLIEVDRPDQLAECVARLNALSAEEYQEMCGQARAAAQRFSPETAYNNLMQYYERVLEQS